MNFATARERANTAVIHDDILNTPGYSGDEVIYARCDTEFNDDTVLLFKHDHECDSYRRKLPSLLCYSILPPHKKRHVMNNDRVSKYSLDSDYTIIRNQPLKARLYNSKKNFSLTQWYDSNKKNKKVSYRNLREDPDYREFKSSIESDNKKILSEQLGHRYTNDSWNVNFALRATKNVDHYPSTTCMSKKLAYSKQMSSVMNPGSLHYSSSNTLTTETTSSNFDNSFASCTISDCRSSSNDETDDDTSKNYCSAIDHELNVIIDHDNEDSRANKKGSIWKREELVTDLHQVHHTKLCVNNRNGNINRCCDSSTVCSNAGSNKGLALLSMKNPKHDDKITKVIKVKESENLRPLYGWEVPGVESTLIDINPTILPFSIGKNNHSQKRLHIFKDTDSTENHDDSISCSILLSDVFETNVDIDVDNNSFSPFGCMDYNADYENDVTCTNQYKEFYDQINFHPKIAEKSLIDDQQSEKIVPNDPVINSQKWMESEKSSSFSPELDPFLVKIMDDLDLSIGISSNETQVLNTLSKDERLSADAIVETELGFSLITTSYLTETTSSSILIDTIDLSAMHMKDSQSSKQETEVFLKNNHHDVSACEHESSEDAVSFKRNNNDESVRSIGSETRNNIDVVDSSRYEFYESDVDVIDDFIKEYIEDSMVDDSFESLSNPEPGDVVQSDDEMDTHSEPYNISTIEDDGCFFDATIRKYYSANLDVQEQRLGEPGRRHSDRQGNRRTQPSFGRCSF